MHLRLPALLLTALLAAGCAEQRTAGKVAKQNPPPPTSDSDDRFLGPRSSGDADDRVDVAPVPSPDRGDRRTNRRADDEPAPGGNPVPEPGPILLVGTGLAAFAIYHRRRRRQRLA